MKTPKPAKKTRAQLESKIRELEASLVHVYHFAALELPKAANLIGSGVVIEIKALGGRTIVQPVMIKDGLSQATVDALRADLIRSYESAIEFKPKGAKA